MSLLSLLFVLALEQFKALPAVHILALQTAGADLLERQFNGGEYRHGVAAWMVGVALPAFLVLAVHLALASLHAVLAFVFDVVVLYLLVGFRQFSHFFTDIQLALRAGEIERARRLLDEWRGIGGGERLGSNEITRLAIEQGIVASHRHVFAPMFWFVLCGPGGAVLYRLALAAAERWTSGGVPQEGSQRFGAFARQAFLALDWLPVRLTAITFAIVGDFEDAVYCWRTQARQWPDAASGILLASGAGALGIRLGQPLPEAMGIDVRPELGLGDDADVEHLQSAIGLVWRTLVLCLLLLALLTVASWAGS